MPALQRAFLPFVVFQAALATLAGFTVVRVSGQGGAGAAVHFVALYIGTTAFHFALVFWLARHLRISVRALVQVAFVLPALMLVMGRNNTDLQALALGTFIGLSWVVRHCIELGHVDNTARDTWSAVMTAADTASALLCTLGAALALAVGSERHDQLVMLYGAFGLTGGLWCARLMPDLTVPGLRRPREIVRQRAWLHGVPILLLSSAMAGVGVVMTGVAAAHALAKPSTYGWASGLAMTAGAVALFSLRNRRRGTNRSRDMGLACVGMVCAYLLLALSGTWAWLFVPYLVVLALVQPFWRASEAVLNLRLMDLQGALPDRILVRESSLAVFRLVVLYGFWSLVQGWTVPATLALGTGLVAAAVVLEWGLGRTWMRTLTEPGQDGRGPAAV